jgi:hypothetical protein
MPLIVGLPTMTFGFIVIRDNRISVSMLIPLIGCVFLFFIRIFNSLSKENCDENTPCAEFCIDNIYLISYQFQSYFENLHEIFGLIKINGGPNAADHQLLPVVTDYDLNQSQFKRV